eukprot:TRINITY_DN18101_c0_g1_i2.p1 TRINITY_DN18101_c0_g1~~TRINITY_DN18101_c0_g1_i2.p1  ORF type:complete len:488 (-),score=92.47 TRINITY_DN18101_c0_g1_i2:119-1363(-)
MPGEDAGSVGAGSSREFFHGVGHGTSVAESTESYSNVPLCFGEQLVLETYMRNKGRRYDRKRQDELSQPRRPKGDSWASGYQGGEPMDDRVLDKQQLKNLVARLAKPKRHLSNEDAGQMVMLHSMRDEALKRQSAADTAALIKRLAAPKASRAYDPTPGERICMMYNRWKPTRAVNLERLADMAKPKKRGGRAESWGVGSRTLRSEGSMSMTSTPRDHSSIMQQLPPVSARGPSPGAGQDSSRSIETSRIERLPEENRALPEEFHDHSFPSPAAASHPQASPYQGGAVAAAAANWQPVESRPPVARGCSARDQAAPSGMEDFNNDDEGSDYYDEEESDDPVSYRPVALQSNASGRPHAGAGVPTAPAQPAQSNYSLTLHQGAEEEEESDDEEPIFPQFGFAGQRTRPPPSPSSS